MLDEKIFERYKKLQAMTTSSNPHEADTAKRMVEELIARHGITDEDLDRFEATASHEEPAGLAQEDWKFRLATAVAQFFECDVLRFVIGEKKKIRIVGPRDKVKIASKNLEIALEDLKVLERLFLRETKGMIFSSDDTVKDGLADGMIERIKVARHEARMDYELTLQGNELAKLKSKKKTKRETVAATDAAVKNPDSEGYLIAYGIALERYTFVAE